MTPAESPGCRPHRGQLQHVSKLLQNANLKRRTAAIRATRKCFTEMMLAAAVVKRETRITFTRALELFCSTCLLDFAENAYFFRSLKRSALQVRQQGTYSHAGFATWQMIYD